MALSHDICTLYVQLHYRSESVQGAHSLDATDRSQEATIQVATRKEMYEQ